jgi:AAA+ ATPase superfamily predicted ATPase
MIGREEHLNRLNSFYESKTNNLTVLYGRHRLGKTAIIKEFIKDKSCVYFDCTQTVDFELLSGINRAFKAQLNNYNEATSYEGALEQLDIDNTGVRLLVFEEFQNIVKADLGFLVSLLRFMQENEKGIMVIFTSSSVAWVENSMVKSIGRAALSINAFIKVKELSYADMVGMLPENDAKKLLSVYAITGGVPGYIRHWNVKETVKENICRLYLNREGIFAREAELFIRDEFRESGVYNTILKCLAEGMNKLNEIHEYTGYGRDKISVYLKNLIEREIVEKVFSYDFGVNENTRKGLYRIKDDFTSFWYRFVYPHYGVLGIVSPEEFYDRYIEPGLDEFLLEAFIKIAGEFMDIIKDMGRMPVEAEKKGRWYGKAGDLHVVYETEEGAGVIGQAFAGDRPVSTEDYEEILRRLTVAGIKDSYVYIFSACGFTQEIIDMAGDKIIPIAIEDL